MESSECKRSQKSSEHGFSVGVDDDGGAYSDRKKSVVREEQGSPMISPHAVQFGYSSCASPGSNVVVRPCET